MKDAKLFVVAIDELCSVPSTPTCRLSSAPYTIPTSLAVSEVLYAADGGEPLLPSRPGAAKIPKALPASQPAWPSSDASSPWTPKRRTTVTGEFISALRYACAA